MHAAGRSAAAPSGEQYEIGYEDQVATLVEVGGGVRAYTDGGVDVLQPYASDAMCDGAHGTPLVPWPNRLGDGRYDFAGNSYQLPLTEPDKGNAIHGLLRWVSWQARTREPARVVLGAHCNPQPGYPFTLDVEVDYQLSEQGLTVRTTARNLGTETCPFGAGQHPYLSPGDGPIDDCELQFAAGTLIETGERQLPTGTAPVAGGRYDFRTARRLGDLAIDLAFADLDRDERQRVNLALHRPDGRTTTLWADPTYPYLQVFTADTLAPERRRRGLGVEPMTCPPDAFRSGTALHELAPGDSLTMTWGVRMRADAGAAASAVPSP